LRNSVGGHWCAGPFVEDQHAREVMQVSNLRKLFVRKKIVQRSAAADRRD